MSGGGYGGQPQGYGAQPQGFGAAPQGNPFSNRYSAFGGMPQPRQQFFQGQQGYPQSFYNPTTGMMEQNQTAQPKPLPPPTGGYEPMPNNLREPPTGGLEPLPTDPIQMIGGRARLYQNYGITGPQAGGYTGTGANPVQSPNGGAAMNPSMGAAPQVGQPPTGSPFVAYKGGTRGWTGQFTPYQPETRPEAMSEPASQSGRQAPAGYYYNQDGSLLLGSDPNKAMGSRPSYAGTVPNNGLRPTGPTTLPPQYNIGRPPPIGSQHYNTWTDLYGGGGDYMAGPKIPWGPGNPVYDSIAMTYPGR